MRKYNWDKRTFCAFAFWQKRPKKGENCSKPRWYSETSVTSVTQKSTFRKKSLDLFPTCDARATLNTRSFLRAFFREKSRDQGIRHAAFLKSLGNRVTLVTDVAHLSVTSSLNDNAGLEDFVKSDAYSWGRRDWRVLDSCKTSIV